MPKPLISILTPFKNTAFFLEDCLKSIQSQTYIHWELLIVDDSSTDDSFEIVRRFAEKDSRIKLLKNSGHGIIDALRVAFKQSQGDLITRMDSDDIMLPDKLEILAENLLEHGKGYIAVGLVKYFAEAGVKSGFKRYELWLNELTLKGANFTEIYKECVIPSPNWLVYKSDLISVDAFNSNIYPEDYDLSFRFYKAGFKCIPCDDILHLWRDYPTRTSRTHKHYAENYFLSIKMHYFLQIDYNPKKTLVIWRAGNKGKNTAKILIDKQIPFDWVCDNPKKIGKIIYGQMMQPFDALQNIQNPQSIITVANAHAQIKIRSYLKNLNLKAIEDYIFVC